MPSDQLPAITYGTHRPVMKFDDLDEAQDFITQSAARDPLHLGEPLRLVLGDIDADGENPQFLVATADDAAFLVEAGYQYGDGVGLDEGQTLSL